MSVKATFMVPHPPLIVKEVGKGNEKQVQKTIDAYEEVAKEIVENNLSVRETEKRVQNINKEKENEEKTVSEKIDRRPQYYREVELSLSESFGRKVVVNQKNKNSGTLVLEFYGEDDLKELMKHFKDDN